MRDRLLESYREDEATLDAARDQRVRGRISQLTREQRDDEGRWPFWADPTPLDGGFGKEAKVPKADGQSRRLLSLAAAVLVVVLVGGAVALRLTPGGDSSSEMGTESIESLAALARQQPDQPLAPGEYLHQSWEEAVSAGGSALTELMVETWIGMDGTGREVRSEQVLIDPVTGERTVRAPGTDLVASQPGRLVFGGLSYEQLRQLPTDATGVLEVVAEVASIASGNELWLIEELVRAITPMVVPPEARAAGLDALALLGGEQVGPRVDRLGRTGQGILVPSSQGDVLVIVDPATAAVWERRTGASGEGEPSVADAVGWRTVVAQEKTTSIE